MKRERDDTGRRSCTLTVYRFLTHTTTLRQHLVGAAVGLSVILAPSSARAADPPADRAADDVWLGAGVGAWIEIPFIFEWHWTAVAVSTHHDLGIPWWFPDVHIEANKDIIPGITIAKAGIWINDPPPFGNFNAAAFDLTGEGFIDLLGYGDIDPIGKTEIVITNYLWEMEEIQILRDLDGDMNGDILIFQGSLLEFEPGAFGLEELIRVHAIPGPSSIALLTLAGSVGARRRRRR